MNEDEINLKEFFEVLWAGKKLIIIVTAVFAIISVVYALSLNNYYKSEAVLIISDDSNEGSGISNLTGLASVAGINVPSSGQDKPMLVVETLKSRAFLKHLLEFDGVLASLMATKSFDNQSQSITYDPNTYDVKNDKWLRKPSNNRKSKPSYLESYDQYLSNVSIEQDANPNLIFMSVEHLSPIFAKDFLELMINQINELLRDKDLKESSDAIAFLSTEMAKSNFVSMKDAINQLVQSKLETQMMARISSDYILKIVEPPFVPEKKSKPQRSLICILGTLLGGALAVLWLLISHYLLQNKKN